MTPAGRIEAAIELLDLIDEPGRPADQVASEYFRGHRYIGSKDRRAISELVYAAVRRRAALDWWLARQETKPSARGRMIAALALIEGWSAERIGGAFDGVRYHPKPLSQSERALARSLERHTLE